MAESTNPETSKSSGQAPARYKALSPAKLPICRPSPARLTIPPCFSPSALLESPVLLTNIKAEPSPTTGTFFLPSIVSSSPRNAVTNHDSSTFKEFEFKPPNQQYSATGFSPLGSLNHSQAESSCAQLVEPGQAVDTSNELIVSSTSNPTVEAVCLTANSPLEMECDGLEEMKGSENGTQVVQSEHNNSSPSAVSDKSLEDGYNWRKYGQKHVKGSEYPRSYYKCTHPNCNVKKQLERSHDGQITEIIYKGSHDHPKPQTSRRLAITAMLCGQGEEKCEGFPPSMTSEDKLASGHAQSPNHANSNFGPELSPASISDDDLDNGGGAQRNDVGNGIAEDDDPEAKRRRMDALGFDPTGAVKPNREPRVVVQTVSEVDILDDGYRWRKYGQKVVKGNPNPRSYYKCTSVGCPVRKHVERASHDPKAVITTYEGKHNHDVPAARNSTHEAASMVPTETVNHHDRHMPLALSSITQACDPMVFSHHYPQQEENNAISLDLGVGISPRSRDNAAAEKKQALKNGGARQIPFANSECSRKLIQAHPYPVLYGSPNVIYGSTAGKADGFAFMLPALNRSSNTCYANPGNLVMGP